MVDSINQCTELVGREPELDTRREVPVLLRRRNHLALGGSHRVGLGDVNGRAYRDRPDVVNTVGSSILQRRLRLSALLHGLIPTLRARGVAARLAAAHAAGLRGLVEGGEGFRRANQ